MKSLGFVAAAMMAQLVTGCGGSGTPAPSAARPTPGPVTGAAEATPSVMPKEPEAGPPLPAIAYQARNRRDPFVPTVIEEGKGQTVNSAKLVGIVQGRQGPLALVEAADGLGYILKAGDVFANGRVTEIGTRAVSFAVAARAGEPSTTVTLRLATD